MSLIKLQGNASGTGAFTIAAPNSNTDRTLTLPDSSGTMATAESTLSQFNASGSAPVYACRAWVNFNGTGTVAIRASGNVSSITDNGAGDYTVNFTTAMPDNNYATNLSGGEKVEINNKKYVKYIGMASKESIQKLQSKKSTVSIEGVSGLIPYAGETEEVLNNIFGNLRSAVAYYAGCKNWDEFRRNVKFLEITQQGWEESKTRVNL